MQPRYETHKAQLSNGETICYIEQGTDFKGKQPTILLIHGNLSTKQWWYDNLELLQKSPYHVLAVDQRGFGESTYITPCNCFGDWARDLIELCEQIKVTQCMAVGWSFGGTVAMKLAQMAPQLVSKVVPTCSVAWEGYYIDTKGGPVCKTREQIKENKRFQFMTDILVKKNYEAMDQIWGAVLFNVAKDYPSEKRKIFMIGPFQQRSYLDAMYSMANSDIDIKTIKAQGLVIHGKQDLVIVADSLKGTIEHFGRAHVRENNAHMLPIEDPKWFVLTLLSFVSEK